jgi:hypothetical protein
LACTRFNSASGATVRGEPLRLFPTSDVAGSRSRCDERSETRDDQTLAVRTWRGLAHTTRSIGTPSWGREAELQATEVERIRLAVPRPYATATAEKILELAKQAEFLYKPQNPGGRRDSSQAPRERCDT